MFFFCRSCMSQESGRPRVVLSDEEAREIFKLQTTHGYPSLHAASVVYAKKYGVSPKAIRDIWTGRSWLEATFSLWNADERPERRTIGRPKGRKDSKPRKSKYGGQSIPGGQDVSACPIRGAGDNFLRHSGPGESATCFPISTQLERSTQEEAFSGSACYERAIPFRSQNSIFQAVPESFGGPSFNSLAGLISANILLNQVLMFGESYTPACLRLPTVPSLEIDSPEFTFGGGLLIDTALARPCFQSRLLHSDLQSHNPFLNQFPRAWAGGCSAFRPS